MHPDWEQNGCGDYRDVVDRLCENVMTAVRLKIDTTAISACVQHEGELVNDKYARFLVFFEEHSSILHPENLQRQAGTWEACT